MLFFQHSGHWGFIHIRSFMSNTLKNRRHLKLNWKWKCIIIMISTAHKFRAKNKQAFARASQLCNGDGRIKIVSTQVTVQSWNEKSGRQAGSPERWFVPLKLPTLKKRIQWWANPLLAVNSSIDRLARLQRHLATYMSTSMMLSRCGVQNWQRAQELLPFRLI